MLHIGKERPNQHFFAIEPDRLNIIACVMLLKKPEADFRRIMKWVFIAYPSVREICAPWARPIREIARKSEAKREGEFVH